MFLCSGTSGSRRGGVNSTCRTLSSSLSVHTCISPMATSLRTAGVELLILLHGRELISAEHFTWSSSFLVEHLLLLTTSSWMVSKACVRAATLSLVSNLCTLNLELEGGHLEPGSALHFFLPATGIRVSSGRGGGGGGGLEFSSPVTIHPPPTQKS